MEVSYTLSEKEWDYLAEGNQHLVLKYLTDPFKNPENFFSGKVLKIEKIFNQKDPDENSLKLQNLNDILNHYVCSNFYNGFQELMTYVPFEQKITVGNKTEFLLKISEKIEEKRPEERKMKSINVFSEIVLSENLNLFYPKTKGFIIEIKPKSPLLEEIDEAEFFMILEENFPDLLGERDKVYEDLKEKLSELRFNKMKLVKKQEKSSEMDPRLLFSQDYQGIKKSIESLVNTPMNNFLVHFNNTGIETKELVEDITNVLFSNKQLLGFIQDFQRLFEGKNQEIIALAEKLNFDDLQDAVLSEAEILKNSEKKDPNNEIFRKVLQFLISLTWKDLGIIINFVLDEGKTEMQEILQKKYGFKRTEGRTQGLYRIGLIDIKLKGIQKLLEFKKSQSKINHVFVCYLINNYIKNKFP